MENKIIFVDIDNTICITPGDYANAEPIVENIAKINQLYAKNIIVYWTARGVLSGKDYWDLTQKQLAEWGCKYHKLKMDKPVFDLFIDDKVINSKEFFNEKRNS